MPSRNRLLKLLGLSTVLGVAATGVLIARSPRTSRTDYERWQITERLRRRHHEARLRLEEAEAGVWGSE